MKKKFFLAIGMVVVTMTMLWLTFFLMKLPWLAGDEKFLIWSTSAVKLAVRDVPDPENFALINTSYDLELIDRFDDYGFPVGNQVITDRNKLSVLLDIISKSEKPPKYILCDIHFVDATDHDEALRSSMTGFENLILSAHLNDEDEVEQPIFDHINYGLSDYVIGNLFDGVYKYQLYYQDSLKLTPLKIYEDLNHIEAAKSGLMVNLGNYWMPNNFIVNYKILQKDINELESGFNPINLGELLMLPDEDIQQFVGGKILVIGDFFEQDMHETLFELTSGPLILLNTLLTLEEADTYVNVWFFILIGLVYSYLSFMVIYEGDFLEKLVKEKFGTIKLARYLAGFMNYLIILSILSVATFFLFNIHLNVFYLAVAFYTLDKLVGWIYKMKQTIPIPDKRSMELS